MIAFFDDGAIFENRNVCGASNRTQPVGYDKAGAPFHQMFEGHLHLVLTLGIECAGGFVEDEDGRVSQDGSGNGNSLALSTGEGYSTLADHGLVAISQFLYKAVGMCCPSGGDDVTLGRLGSSVRDVVGDGGVEKEGVLAHHADLIAERA